MEIVGKKVYLRDFEEADIADHIYWNTKETEWKKWDTPWVRSSVFDEAEYREKMWKKCQRELSSQAIRYSFEICEKDTERHIGWMNAYTIDRKYEACSGDGDIALGIDIPESAFRKKGYGKEAFSLFINYWNEQGYQDIYTQTWSGNDGMIALAKSLGFTLCKRKNGIYQLDGQVYDWLTFVY